MTMHPMPRLIDSTLREGEQLYGAYFSPHTKHAILRGLVRVGVEEIEIGNIAQEDLPELAAGLRSASPSTAIAVWTPLRRRYIARAAELDVDMLHAGLPVSEEHIRGRLRIAPDELLYRLEAFLERAAAQNRAGIALGLEDAGRAHPETLGAVCALAERYNVSRLRVADTLGRFSPLMLAGVLRDLQARTSLPLAVHCHNDFGMAAANVITAFDSGARFADVSVLGIGERAGIAPLEEVAAYLRLRFGAPYDLRGLKELSALVAKAADVGLSRVRPVVGRDIFAVESGIHVQGVLRKPSLFEPFSPEDLGHARRVGVGKKSGRTALAAAFAGLGETCSAQEMDRCLEKVRALSADLGRPLTRDELLRVLETVRRQPSTGVPLQ